MRTRTKNVAKASKLMDALKKRQVPFDVTYEGDVTHIETGGRPAEAEEAFNECGFTCPAASGEMVLEDEWHQMSTVAGSL